VFQLNAIYGLDNTDVATNTTLGGSAYTEDSLFVAQTNTTQYASGVIQSKKRLKYRSGQGSVGRFTAIFTTPVSYSYQVAGFGHSEDGLYFGYKEISGGTPQFGVLYVNRGKREIQTLTLSAASSTNENITIRLGNSYGVPNNNTVAVTNSANINRTVWEIATASYVGWDAYASGSTVIFVANSAGNVTGTFGITASTAGGSFVETRSGATATEQFVPQSAWNGDTLLGTGGTATGLMQTNPEMAAYYNSIAQQDKTLAAQQTLTVKHVLSLVRVYTIQELTCYLKFLRLQLLAMVQCKLNLVLLVVLKEWVNKLLISVLNLVVVLLLQELTLLNHCYKAVYLLLRHNKFVIRTTLTVRLYKEMV